MKYYAKFDNGPEINTEILYSVENPGDGWYEILDHSSEKNYKLINETPVALDQEELSQIINEKMSVAKMEAIRMERNAKLNFCDWTQSADSPLSDSKKLEWSTYRQQLRDFPASLTDVLGEISWPTPPSN